MKILVIIPTYNEKENIQKLVEKILNLNLNLLIVDDNSPDGTGEIADELARMYSQVKIIHRQDERSEGLSRRDGYRYALTYDYDYILEMDADLSHNPEEIPKFLQQIRECDVVIGSRFISGSKQVGRSIFRRLGSRLANFYICKMLKIENIRDCASGYRCYRREVLEKINLNDINFTGPASLIKLLFKGYELGFKIKEIPITYWERKFGRSKKNSPWFIIEALWTVFKLRFAKNL
jgi:dolichol-phosphate mannosyltransferase